MMEYLRMERDYIPWKTALDQLERLKYMLEGTVVEARFAKWMQSLIQPLLDHLGYVVHQKDPEDQRLFKRHMVAQGGRTWLPFVGGKNGHENFRQARIYNFCNKFVVFARNRKLANLTQ